MQPHIKKLLSHFHGKETYLHHYIAGFVDGEGSFSVAIIQHPMQKFGWMINPCFQAYQHEQHREILELLQYVFKTGSIYRKSGTHHVLNFSIDSRRSLIEKVIPFFDRFQPIVKQDAYRKFRYIVLMMEQKQHLTKSGFRKIVELAYTMNQQGKGRKHPKEYILSNMTSPRESSETIRQIPNEPLRRIEGKI
ncbi:MAG: LAGLIDADG family homing endonuclease [Candidatus Kerfeldbacteria bacterium]|nr:LAGLIDADG family homing endonuclease [Candidatus Kerfeldbacteria bacterium]